MKLVAGSTLPVATDPMFLYEGYQMEKKIFLCSKADIQPGGVIQVCPTEVADGLAVYNVEGRFYATEDLCTHGRVGLSGGELDGNTIYCPLHGGAFNVCTGEAVEKPCVTPLQTYQVVEEGDSIFCIVG